MARTYSSVAESVSPSACGQSPLQRPSTSSTPRTIIHVVKNYNNHNRMYVSGCCSTQLLQNEDGELTMLFMHLRESLQQRLVVMYKMERYIKEQYHETLKKYRRLVAAEMSIESQRNSFEKMLLQHLASSQKLTKRHKGLLTEFCFDAIERLAPALDCKLQRHYVNIPRLLEIYFHSCGSDQHKRLTQAKGNNLAYRPDYYVGLLRVLLEHVHKMFVNRLTLVGRRIDQMIDMSMRTQIILENTAKSFYNFQHRKLKTDPSADESPERRQNRNSSPYKRISNILPALAIGGENNFLESRKMSINSKDETLETSIREVQILKKIRKVKADSQLSSMTNVLGKTIKSRELTEIESVDMRKFPCISSSLIVKSPSLKHYEDSKLETKNNLKEISSTSLVREESPYKATLVNGKNLYTGVFQDFLDIFNRNLIKMYKTSGIKDLDFEWFNSRQKKTSLRTLKKSKADWLNQNLLKVVQYLTIKNNWTVKSLEQYTQEHTHLSQKFNSASKGNIRKRNLVTK